jgi:hypothetical protein
MDERGPSAPGVRTARRLNGRSVPISAASATECADTGAWDPIHARHATTADRSTAAGGSRVIRQSRTELTPREAIVRARTPPGVNRSRSEQNAPVTRAQVDLRSAHRAVSRASSNMDGGRSVFYPCDADRDAVRRALPPPGIAFDSLEPDLDALDPALGSPEPALESSAYAFDRRNPAFDELNPGLAPPDPTFDVESPALDRPDGASDFRQCACAGNRTAVTESDLLSFGSTASSTVVGRLPSCSAGRLSRRGALPRLRLDPRHPRRCLLPFAVGRRSRLAQCPPSRPGRLRALLLRHRRPPSLRGGAALPVSGWLDRQRPRPDLPLAPPDFPPTVAGLHRDRFAHLRRLVVDKLGTRDSPRPRRRRPALCRQPPALLARRHHPQWP